MQLFLCLTIDCLIGRTCLITAVLKVSTTEEDGKEVSVTVRLYGPNTEYVINRERELQVIAYALSCPHVVMYKHAMLLIMLCSCCFVL